MSVDSTFRKLHESLLTLRQEITFLLVTIQEGPEELAIRDAFQDFASEMQGQTDQVLASLQEFRTSGLEGHFLRVFLKSAFDLYQNTLKTLLNLSSSDRVILLHEMGEEHGSECLTWTKNVQGSLLLCLAATLQSGEAIYTCMDELLERNTHLISMFITSSHAP